MAGIKSVKKAHTVQCKDAVTKKAIKAVFSTSHDAVYEDISIHKVKLADTLKSSVKDVDCVYSNFNIIPTKKATIDYIYTDIFSCKKADKDLTIEELFKNI